MDILIVRSGRTFKNVGVVAFTESGTFYRGSGSFNHDALELLFSKEYWFDSVDDEGNFYTHLVDFSKPESIKYIKRILPSFWFVDNHFEGKNLSKDSYFNDYCYVEGEPTKWTKVP